MGTNNNDDKSPEEGLINTILFEASEKIAAIEEQISKLPSEKGPQLILKPEGMPNLGKPFSTRQMESYLRNQIADIKVSTSEKCKLVIDGLDPKVKDEQQSLVEKSLYPAKDPKEIELNRAEGKNLDASQEFLTNLHYQNKHQVSAEKSKNIEPENNKQEFKETASDIFSNSLNYTMQENARDITNVKSEFENKTIESKKDIDIDKD